MEQKVPTKTSSLPTRQQQLFVSALTALTWQLMIVILAPTIGGHFIDQATHDTPRWTIVGLVTALVLAGVCVYNGYRVITNSKNEAKDV